MGKSRIATAANRRDGSRPTPCDQPLVSQEKVSSFSDKAAVANAKRAFDRKLQELAEADRADPDSPVAQLRRTPIGSNSGNAGGALEALRFYGIPGWTASTWCK
jgi:hypothetical protein